MVFIAFSKLKHPQSRDRACPKTTPYTVALGKLLLVALQGGLLKHVCAIPKPSPFVTKGVWGLAYPPTHTHTHIHSHEDTNVWKKKKRKENKEEKKRGGNL